MLFDILLPNYDNVGANYAVVTQYFPIDNSQIQCLYFKFKLGNTNKN